MVDMAEGSEDWSRGEYSALGWWRNISKRKRRIWESQPKNASLA